ncbi:hypothetical protein RvY_10108 [Ramazzottius varieornatus]|uniref:Rho GTPase-activating protein 15 n=1 Tax=Ramazzottius varieornatus TaxID=947166 RepID=A0A1D1VE44_RAMVA|nr:hypothetical protein RvY_10108 [Ramazzottius varieornatus]
MTSSFVRVVLDYACSIEGQPERHIHVGDTFQLLKKTSSSWWHVRRDSVETAFYVPTSCVQEIGDIHSLSLNSPRRGISRSESSLDRLRASSAYNVEPPSGDAAASLSSSSGEDLERGDHYDNPVYALPNVTFLRHISHESSEISTEEESARPSPQYANMKITLNAVPPLPTLHNQPIRTLEDSWEEFEDTLGRRYFFHPKTNISSWKPPRRQINPELAEANVDVDAEVEALRDPPSKVAFTASSSRLHEDQMQSCKAYQETNETNHQTTATPHETDTKMTVALLYSDIAPSPSSAALPSAHSSNTVASSPSRHVSFASRFNRASSLMEEKHQQRGEETIGAEGEAEKENTAAAAEEEEKRKSASLPMPRRSQPSKDFLELRQLIANKVSLPERAFRTKSVLLLNEAHLNEFDLLAQSPKIGGMRNSKTLPSFMLGKTWRPSENAGILQGFLNVTKYSENGRRMKKQWLPSFVILTDTSLFVYRPPFALDQSPEVFMDLAGATIKWSKEKSHRKNVFEVSAADGSQILVQDDNKTVSHEWVNCIVQALAHLPLLSVEDLSPVKVLPTTPTDFGRPMSSPKLSRILARTWSAKARPEEPPADVLEPSTSPTRTHKKKKSVDEMETADIKVKKMKIIERLKNFFSRRPTLESLKAKGIIRDGPVFGCNFAKLCEHEKNDVPAIVRRCIAAIEKKDMRTDGIYRVSGNLSQVQKLRFQIDQDKYSGMESEEDVNVLTGLLKLFFRELKEPMIPFHLYDPLMKANKIQEKEAKEKRFRDLIAQLPRSNSETLRFLLLHLYRVADFGDQNRMHLPNLAIVFGPTLMWPEVPSVNLATDMLCQNQVVEYILLSFRALFDCEMTSTPA